ncbi:universal stress protein [Natronolimnohabitans innermongolicus]|uniref:UspA domain-containing protein n=1 Tax=Natronolimnohabitans innermongolicus JCM 12255 TaxID=1227499 RepID=L9XDL3_9EURY|nr:universal stress protein [Natronolimnohabitans innermongolicus]ELY58718.1 UspA domain-containing protein [Natronolimnohabitans innermongolicus JCM 12255]
MSHTVLVPHDGSSHAQTAFEYALETFPDARIVLFHAIDPFEVTPNDAGLPRLTEEWHDEQRDSADDLFADALETVTVDEDTTIETDTAVGNPPQTIVAYVADTDVDQVVMGSRGPGRPNRPLGSTAELVVRRADVPVTVVR